MHGSRDKSGNKNSIAHLCLLARAFRCVLNEKGVEIEAEKERKKGERRG